MLQEIKYRLFEIFLTQKKKLALLACFVFLGLFIGFQSTHAFVLDLANVQLDALDFIDNTVLKYLVSIALWASESIILLLVSANLLDWSSSLPVTLSDNGLVNAGWGFTSGLANLSFILIFIVIALAYILKLETFGMKKALPKLIIVAVLINFSLLFVKMLADIGWVFQNSFASVFFENGQLAAKAIESLKTNSVQLMAVVIGIPAAYLPIALIPYGNVVALFTIGLMLLTGGGKAILLGTLSQTIMVIVFNLVVGLVFLVFSALFLIRIAAIWLLAIFAPLAFVAYILPNTQKLFSQWLKALVQWIFLGVVVFFLIGLGIKLFGLVDLGSKDVLFPKEVGDFQFFNAFYKYIFLIIYLIVVLGACKKLVPAGTQMIWGVGEMALNRGGKWVGERARKVGLGGISREREGALRAAQRLEMLQGKKTLTAGEKIAKGWWTARKLGRSPELLKSEKRVADTTLMMDERERLLKRLPKDPDDRKAFLEAELSRMEREDPLGLKRRLNRPKIGAIGDLIQKDGKVGSVAEKFIEDMIRGGTNPDKLLEKRPDLAQRITGVTDPDKIKKLREELQTDLRKQGLSDQEFQKKLNEKTEQKLIAEVMGKIKPEDLGKRMQTEAAKNVHVVEQILRDQAKLNDFSRNAKMEVKKTICDTITKNPQNFSQSPLREKVYNITQSPRWPLRWQEPTEKTTSAGTPRPQATSRPQRTPKPKK